MVNDTEVAAMLEKRRRLQGLPFTFTGHVLSTHSVHDAAKLAAANRRAP